MSAVDVMDSQRIDPESLLQFSFNCNFEPLKNAMICIMEQLKDNNANIQYLKQKIGIPNTEHIPVATSSIAPSVVIDLKVKFLLLTSFF